MTVVRSGRARGRVQGVMFRQTFVRGLQKRGLQGGASNTPRDRNEVTFTLIGDPAAIDGMLEKLRSGDPINSWGARVEALELLDTTIPMDHHDVTTRNVDDFRWSPGVEMYL